MLVRMARRVKRVKEISRRLDEYITPYNPETWRSPKDATARELYT